MIESASQPQTETASRGASPRPLRVDEPLTLESLAARTSEELGALYARATCPDSMAALNGDLTGRMLAVCALDGARARGMLAAFARGAAFPWGGKSFVASSAQRGTGINRVRLFGQHRLFPFATRFEPSALDGAPALILDYGDRENPSWIRAIHDEVRAVAPDLYLGPACIRRAPGKGGPRVVLWFALDARWARASAAKN